MINHMSITRKLYMGHTVQIRDDKIDGYYCKQEAGIIISRALLISVMPEMNKCLTGITNVPADEWLGRCILTLTKGNWGFSFFFDFEALKSFENFKNTCFLKSMNKGEVGCVSSEEIQSYQSIAIQSNDLNFDPEIEPAKKFEESVSAFPVDNQQMMFKLHKKFSEVEIDITYRIVFLLSIMRKISMNCCFYIIILALTLIEYKNSTKTREKKNRRSPGRNQEFKFENFRRQRLTQLAHRS